MVVIESKKRVLSINCTKTMPGCKQKVRYIRLSIGTWGNCIEKVEKFSCLGNLITSDGKCDSEIKRRIGLSKSIFEKMKKILRSRQLSMKTRLRVLHC